MFVPNTRAYNVDEIETRGQFHQHFTRAFFVPKCYALLSLVTFHLCNFWCKNIGKKCAPKMLIKLAPIRYDFKQHLQKSNNGKYRWTSLYARDKDSKNMLAYNEFAYKKTNDHCKLEDRFQKKGHFSISYTQSWR